MGSAEKKESVIEEDGREGLENTWARLQVEVVDRIFDKCRHSGLMITCVLSDGILHLLREKDGALLLTCGFVACHLEGRGWGSEVAGLLAVSQIAVIVRLTGKGNTLWMMVLQTLQR